MKIVGACFGRTGTNSLKLALEMLGYGPCHHMFEVRDNPAQLPYWQALARGETPDWSEVFRGYQSCVDWPSARYWRELTDHFPDSKVLLTVRPEDSWFDSVQRTILPSMNNRETYDPGPRRDRSEMAYELIVRQTFNERMDDRAHATAVYRQYIEDVQQSIAPERLLTYTVGDGWAPLCDFFDVPVPDEPFPLTNTTEQFNNRKKS
jgi:hypothetical protein